MVGGFENMFVSVQCSECPSDAISIKWVTQHNANANDDIHACVTLHYTDVYDNIHDCVAPHDAYTCIHFH